MSKLLWNALKLSSVILAATLLLSNRTLAAEAPVGELGIPVTKALEPEVSIQLSNQGATSTTAIASEEIAVPSAPQMPTELKVADASQPVAAQPAQSAPSQPSGTIAQINQYNQAPSSNQPNGGNGLLQQVDQYNQAPTAPAGQVTSVSQLSDVQPTDWAFQALQSLVERYGCIVGYPDGTYRGNRALTRYEFAAGLNACLDRVNELIATATADLVSREDLATLQRLQEEFAAELATLRGRVDALEARTAELEANQFSTTTKLVGEAVVAVADVFNDNDPRAVPSNLRFVGDSPNNIDPDLAEEQEVETTLSYRVRLNFDTSFTGKDLLRTRLQAANVPNFTTGTGTNMTRVGYDSNTGIGSSTSSTGNNFQIDDFFYRFPVGNIANVKIDFAQSEFNDNVFTFNPAFESSGRGSISRFGRFNPIYRQGSGGAGLTVNLFPESPITVSLGYLAPTANDEREGFGLFNGSYAALGQITFRPNDRFAIGATYAHTFQPRGAGVNVSASTGSGFANDPFVGRLAGATQDVSTSANHYGAEASFRITDKITISGWGGLTYATAESGSLSNDTDNVQVNQGDKATIFNWAATLAITDFVKEGSVLGVIFGQPPKVTANEFASGQFRQDDDTSYHLEGLLRYPVTDNIDITPGVIVLFNPEHNNDNDTIFVGTLRTTFRF